jgi:hypothetical protein
LIDC